MRLTATGVALAFISVLAACGLRQSSLEALNEQPSVEYRGHYTVGPDGSWFRECGAAPSDSAWWVTAMGTAAQQVDSARAAGRLQEGQPAYVHWRAVLTRGGEVGPPGSVALLVREIVSLRSPQPGDCSTR